MNDLDVAVLLKDSGLDEDTVNDLSRLFKYTQYLFDDDANLTKTFNLTKEARDALTRRMQELFEGGDTTGTTAAREAGP